MLITHTKDEIVKDHDELCEFSNAQAAGSQQYPLHLIVVNHSFLNNPAAGAKRRRKRKSLAILLWVGMTDAALLRMTFAASSMVLNSINAINKHT